MPYYQPGDIILRDHKIEAFIGQGGFGEVYRAVDLNLHEPVALKILRRSTGMEDGYYDRARDRFTLEARLGHRITHPNIIRIYKFAPDETSGLLVLVMEYASGGSLADKMKSGPLEVSDVLQIARQVAAGLSALHEQDVVHRDLKPSNILFDAYGVAKVADLGLAQPASVIQVSGASSGGGEWQTQPGTPAYMSPEQDNGRLHHLPPSSDIYALGLIIFEMLTRRSYKNQIPGTFVSKLRPEVPVTLDDLLAQMLSEDPRQRPWDGEAAEKAIAAVPEHNPMAALIEVPSISASIGNLEEGLKAIKDMIAAETWQMAAETLSELEADYPHNYRLRLPRMQIDQGLKAQHEAEEKTQREAVAKAKREAEEKAKREAEEKAKREAEEKARHEAEEKTQREAAAKAKREAEEKARHAAEEKAQREAEEKKRRFLRYAGDRIFIRLDQVQEMEFVRIPAGEFWMGSDKKKDKSAGSNEQPQHRVALPEYWMGRTPVNNAQFAAFVQTGGGQAPSGWQNNLPPADKLDHPVVGVSWADAAAYCAWLSQLTGQKVGLPTEAEWEKAARGADERIYPWGGQAPDSSRCNFNLNVKGTTPVGQYSPLGDSPYGCVDMAGNVWEWCADWFDAGYYAGSPATSPPGPAKGQYRVTRGGSWLNESRYVRAAFRYRSAPGYLSHYQGFRCRLSPL